MYIKSLLKKSSIILTLFLLVFMSLYLFTLIFGYTFIPFNEVVVHIFTAGIIVWLTINVTKNRDEKTKMTVVFSSVLPLTAISYIVLKFLSYEKTWQNTMIHCIHACIILVCSMIIFFSYVRGKTARIALGGLYILLSLFVSSILFTTSLFSWFMGGEGSVVKSAISPNTEYLAEAISIDSGAVGGVAVVNISRPNRDINLFIGKLKKHPKHIYGGEWNEYKNMTLRWETDKVLYINENRYLIE